MFKNILTFFTGQQKFGAFSGVFVPTFLSIIGVILYLRLGFIVGSVGIFYTILIIILAVSVTIATGLALSSITTTIRIGAGGAYSIVSKTLGLEVGGSVGIPLILAQIFSVVFYIFGFSEAWNFIFPNHSIKLVAITVLMVLLILTAIRVTAAIRAQIAVFVLIILSLVSILAGGGHWWLNILSSPVITHSPNVSFWSLFALFFPATTGLMAGIGLSGDLSDPKKQIPRGVVTALIATTIIYIIIAIWFSHVATPKELVSNNLIIVTKAIYSPIVLIGILAATFSSALTTFVAAPRLLQALGEAAIVPFGKFFAYKTGKGEPGSSILFVGAVILIALATGSLNSIAPLLTMFFLITYAILNIAVFLELSLGLVSFRPTFKIPRIIPLYGFLGSVVFMFLINVIAGLIAIIFLLGIYIYLIKKQLQPKEGDIRSGLFRAIAEWASKKVITFPESSRHIWKPNILVPVVIARTLLENFPLIRAIAYPNGTMTVLGVKAKKEKKVPDVEDLTKEEIKEELQELPELVKKFGKKGVFTTFSVIDVDDYAKGIAVALEAIESQVFHPNILFLPFKADQLPKTALVRIFETARREKIGVIIIDRDDEIGFGSQEDIHVWISPKVLEKEFYDISRRFDLSMLIAYQLYRNWNGKITLWMCVSEDKKESAHYYMKKLIYEARFPSSTTIKISTESFKKTLEKAPQGDIHIIPVLEEDVKFILDTAKSQDKTFLFVADSTKEDVLA